MTLTTLFDNVPFAPDLRTLWGFSCLVETPERTILFDTGSSGVVLMRHMEALGKSPEAVDMLFCSHAHWDHMGGWDAAVAGNPALELVAPSTFSPRLVRDLRTMVKGVTVVTDEGIRLAEGVYSTGMMEGDPAEQALIVESGEGIVVVTGCAHPGIVAIAERAVAMTGRPIELLMGGFHLRNAPDEAIDRVVTALDALGVRRVCPTHCSGERAFERFARVFGDRCVKGGLGSVVTV